MAQKRSPLEYRRPDEAERKKVQDLQILRSLVEPYAAKARILEDCKRRGYADMKAELDAFVQTLRPALVGDVLEDFERRFAAMQARQCRYGEGQIPIYDTSIARMKEYANARLSDTNNERQATATPSSSNDSPGPLDSTEIRPGPDPSASRPTGGVSTGGDLQPADAAANDAISQCEGNMLLFSVLDCGCWSRAYVARLSERGALGNAGQPQSASITDIQEVQMEMAAGRVDLRQCYDEKKIRSFGSQRASEILKFQVSGQEIQGIAECVGEAFTNKFMERPILHPKLANRLITESIAGCKNR